MKTDRRLLRLDWPGLLRLEDLTKSYISGTNVVGGEEYGTTNRCPAQAAANPLFKNMPTEGIQENGEGRQVRGIYPTQDKSNKELCGEFNPQWGIPRAGLVSSCLFGDMPNRKRLSLSLLIAQFLEVYSTRLSEPLCFNFLIRESA